MQIDHETLMSCGASDQISHGYAQEHGHKAYMYPNTMLKDQNTAKDIEQ